MYTQSDVSVSCTAHLCSPKRSQRTAPVLSTGDLSIHGAQALGTGAGNSGQGRLWPTRVEDYIPSWVRQQITNSWGYIHIYPTN